MFKGQAQDKKSSFYTFSGKERKKERVTVGNGTI